MKALGEEPWEGVFEKKKKRFSAFSFPLALVHKCSAGSRLEINTM